MILTLLGARVFDGYRVIDDAALVLEGPHIVAVVAHRDRPRGGDALDLGGGVLAPGFVDLQVNGGGGVLFNENPTLEGIDTIAAAHRGFGTTSLLPTVITDAAPVRAAALAAAGEAVGRVAGALGIHVEGPFIDPRRAGAHPPEHIRPLYDADIGELVTARHGRLLLTLAPCAATSEQIGRLARAGIVVSLGHAEASDAEAASAFAAGARGVTHLFNAMSPLGHRDPGLVGAALADPTVICGLIADGEHVLPTAVRAAIAAKGAGGIALVSDAMPSAAGGPDMFRLHGRAVRRDGNRLTLADGTLAGATITLLEAVRWLVRGVGVPLADALRMATSTPARLVGVDHRLGRLAPGCIADLVHLGDDIALHGVWVGAAPQAIMR